MRNHAPSLRILSCRTVNVMPGSWIAERTASPKLFHSAAVAGWASRHWDTNSWHAMNV